MLTLSQRSNSMIQPHTQDKIHLIQTPKGLLAHGHLPQIDKLEVDLDESHIHLQAQTATQAIQQSIQLPMPINPEAAIITYYDHQLKMVMPRRNEQ